MKNKWLVQTSGFRSDYIQGTIDTLKRLNFSFDDFGITNERKISNINNFVEDDTRYIARGGILMLDILNKTNSLKDCSVYLDEDKNKQEYINQLKKSIDYSETGFDQSIYKDYGLPLLNNEAEYYTCKNILDKTFAKDMFIKPSKDLKAFNGGIIKTNTTVREHIESGFFKKDYLNETIVIAPLKDIYAEYRFFIIEDKIITGSMYKRGDRVLYDSFIPEDIMEKAIEYAKLYKPADIFVMDLADTKEGIKIVEYNCWNCSGLYNIDIQKLFIEVANYKES